MANFDFTIRGQQFTGRLDNEPESPGGNTRLGEALGALSRRGGELNVRLLTGDTITLTHAEIASLSANHDNSTGPNGRTAMLATMLLDRGALAGFSAEERTQLSTVILGNIDTLGSAPAITAPRRGTAEPVDLDISRGGADVVRLSVGGRPVTTAGPDTPRTTRTHRDADVGASRNREVNVGDVRYHYDHATLTDSINRFVDGATSDGAIAVRYGANGAVDGYLPADFLRAIARAPSFERRIEIVTEIIGPMADALPEASRAGFIRDNAVRVLDSLSHLATGGGATGGTLLLDPSSNQPSRLTADGVTSATFGCTDRALAAMERDGERIAFSFGATAATVTNHAYTPSEVRALTPAALAADLHCTTDEAQRLLDEARNGLTTAGDTLVAQPTLTHVRGMELSLIGPELTQNHLVI